jgi:uncharacterized Ntn-hydrolase superfamily protein
MTFSILARDPITGDIGCAVQSRFLAVGGAVLHARAGVGAVATQALANLTYGPRGLDLLAAGADADQALAILVGSDDLPHRRQAAILDAKGSVSAHTGSGCTAWAGHRGGEGFSCQGNILESERVVAAMTDVMASRGDLPLPERMVSALQAGQAAGGDARGQQSAAILIVRTGGGYGGGSDRYMDLRVDDHPRPIDELERLVGLHRLHFERPRDEDLLVIDGELQGEIVERLAKLGMAPADPDDAAALWAVLDGWAGRENLEERMVREGHIDRTVLAVLRERSS